MFENFTSSTAERPSIKHHFSTQTLYLIYNQRNRGQSCQSNLKGPFVIILKTTWEDFVMLLIKALKHNFALRMGTFRTGRWICSLSDAFIRNDFLKKSFIK